MDSQFDKEGQYFAKFSEDGKLKIWNVPSNSFEQEYVPDLHLSSPCICLQFIESWISSSDSAKNSSPKKKKKRNSVCLTAPDIALGTSSGKLLVYSISKGDVSHVIEGNLNLPINCLSPNSYELLYSGVDEYVVLWDLENLQVVNKWKTGNEKISAILVITDSKRLLTASRSIKLWKLDDKTLIHSFKGHSSEINFLQTIPCLVSNKPKYFISGSKGDRLLNCWNLNENSKDGGATASFLMDDSARSICVSTTSEGSTKLSTSIGSGVVHIFELILNGTCKKPVKPKTTIQAVADTGQKKDIVQSIPIISSYFKNENTLLIAHGTVISLTLESVELENKKVICLLRKVNELSKTSDNKTKVQPTITNDAHYVAPYNNVTNITKRKIGEKPEVPMEQRLENLTINKLDEGKVPKGGNMAQLLLQGLRSKDQNLIRVVLCRKDEEMIKKTIKRLPLNVITELVKELSNLIHGKTTWCEIGAMWLKHLIQIHSAVLMSNPELSDLFASIMSHIDYRLSLHNRLARLKGRLDLIVSQISSTSNEDQLEEEALLVFNDKDSGDSDQEIDMAELLNSTSENEWSEDDDEDDDDNDEDEEMIDDNKNEDSEEDMSE